MLERVRLLLRGSNDKGAAVSAMVSLRPRLVVIVVFDGVQPLDVTGPMSVFQAAEVLRPGSYRVQLASPHGGEVASNAGAVFARVLRLSAVRGAIDTIIVTGGSEEGLRAAIFDDGVREWLATNAPRARRVGSVCTGAFALAAAGLLDGRRATTHWRSCAWLAELCPGAQVEADAIFTIDGPVFTSAGVSAAIDLALALVERDLGRKVAVEVARQLVVFLRRPGGQSQFSAGLAAQEGAGDRVSELIAWATERPDADLRVPALAKRVAMSERHFARVFRRQSGQTPARFVEQLRLDRARLQLEESDRSLSQVASASGFGSTDTLTRAFRRHLGVTPAEYRERFSSSRYQLARSRG